ncbi:MAG TPA: S-adenosylmethionine:tRNA ribosyltransferase-isomerase [Candidatus Baltobacteraceae bacterium]|nr:S-adenosylmethionine:tRNA ribosyltransferase-isomerase [Candidatus Baltobacteraceae bacterium]
MRPAIPELQDAVEPPECRGLARDEVRLLGTNRASGVHSHASFLDLPLLLRVGDVLVVNDSATIPAALVAQRANGESIALHVATAMDARLWTVEPRGSVQPGEELRLPGGACARALAPVDPASPRLWYASFVLPLPMTDYLARYGEPIRYGYVTRRFPLRDYQTIFAREPGSAEMPSAARPFSRRVLAALRLRGVEVVTVTLHCGVSSFESPERPGTERFAVSPVAADAVNRARRERRRIIAVGTTALRALESAASGGELVPARGWTDLVIGDGDRITTADGLLTGFHHGSATHQAILRAFLPDAALASAYDEAARRGYRRHEFGDVHLIV